MIRATFNDNEEYIRVNGLTQWDYGQELQIIGLGPVQNAEVHFALEGRREAEIQTVNIENEILYARIPDKLLEKGENIKAYVYLATPDHGETIKTIAMSVVRRPKPDDYSSPAERNLLRELMEQVSLKADNITAVDGFIQLLAGKKEIGDRIRLPSGTGREIELRNNGQAIQWRYTDSNDWENLANLEDLKGESPEFEIRDGHLIAIYE
ncbi:MAG: hypothetical protein KH330_09865 [Clostridiales bacterium]|nr:hypothetical protein [Clostridiales bacterium]